MSGTSASSMAPTVVLCLAIMFFVADRISRELYSAPTGHASGASGMGIRDPSDPADPLHQPSTRGTLTNIAKAELLELVSRGGKGGMSKRMAEFTFSMIPVGVIGGVLIFLSDVERMSEEIAEERRTEKNK